MGSVTIGSRFTQRMPCSMGWTWAELRPAAAVLDGVAVVRAEAVGHREPVVEEAEVELPGLQDAGDLLEVVGREEVGAAVRVAPGRCQGGAVLRLQEADQVHLSHGCFPYCFAGELPPRPPLRQRWPRRGAVLAS